MSEPNGVRLVGVSLFLKPGKQHGYLSSKVGASRVEPSFSEFKLFPSSSAEFSRVQAVSTEFGRVQAGEFGRVRPSSLKFPKVP